MELNIIKYEINGRPYRITIDNHTLAAFLREYGLYCDDPLLLYRAGLPELPKLSKLPKSPTKISYIPISSRVKVEPCDYILIPIFSDIIDE